MSAQDVTKWNCSVVQSTGGPVSTLTLTTNDSVIRPFTIKGICYSPCPIGGSNNNAGAIGDWFWDTYTIPPHPPKQIDPVTITSWEQTSINDLPKIKALGVNLIRVYCMLQKQLPLNGADNPTVYTHTKFLDACYEQGIFVMVGIPLPVAFFREDETPSPDRSWWSENVTNTVTALGSHPAVMGFTVANEVNDAGNTYGPTSKKNFWWSKVQAVATLAKQAAPNKLIGIANTDDAGICRNCDGKMADTTSIDFWGVNTYQTTNFSSVFGSDSVTTGYAKLTGVALKPVIVTEFGFPSTSRTTANTLHPLEIVSNSDTEQRTATLLDDLFPKLEAEQLSLGVCYFEYCDEWWNQSGYDIASNVTCGSGTYAPSSGNGANGLVPPNDYTQYGGPITCNFPNYYWDNDGFGLYSVAVGSGRNPSNPWGNNAPATPLDTRTPKLAIISSVTNYYGQSYISGVVSEVNVQPGKATQVALSSDQYGRPPAVGQGRLTNYFYDPGDLTPAEEEILAKAKSSGKYITLKLVNGRSITSIIVGS